jgi:hypothetical protein
LEASNILAGMKKTLHLCKALISLVFLALRPGLEPGTYGPFKQELGREIRVAELREVLIGTADLFKHAKQRATKVSAQDQTASISSQDVEWVISLAIMDYLFLTGTATSVMLDWMAKQAAAGRKADARSLQIARAIVDEAVAALEDAPLGRREAG